MSTRANARAGCKALLDAYKAANTNSALPGYLAHVHDHPPGRVTGRSAWVNKEVGETFSLSGNIMQRVMQPSVTVVSKLIDNDQATDEQYAIVDALVALVVTASVQNTIRAITLTPMLPGTVEDAEITSDDGIYMGARLTFNLPVQTGYTL